MAVIACIGVVAIVVVWGVMVIYQVMYELWRRK